MIEVKGLAKSYNGRCVVRIDDLFVRQGELLAILGPNGAGKSTLLRVLHALEPADRGEVWIGGERLTYPAPLELRRRISMVFQRPVLFNGNVRDNVTYGLRLRGGVDKSKVDQIMTRLGLMDFAEANVRTLSGGEVQRVALARSLVLEPDLLLLDEPTANLDPSNAALIETIINELRGKRKSTILLVSHNVSQALRLADRTLVIFSGECIEVVEGENLLESAEDPRTRSYLQGTFPY